MYVLFLPFSEEFIVPQNRGLYTQELGIKHFISETMDSLNGTEI